ncbi:MAG TPA: CBS domain-containing protein [Candidatus Omnitrophota bacterium]|nr:CBS domain-containing protein [Candidatus Omnitrophota bacterium]
MKNRPLKDVMIANPVTLNIDEPFFKIAQIFQEKGIRHLPIVNSQNEIVGVMSQRDFNRITSPRKNEKGEYVYDMDKLAKYILEQYIIQEVITLQPEDTVEKAVELMAEKKLGCVPIVDGKRRVVGIVTAIDMLKLLLKILREG